MWLPIYRQRNIFHINEVIWHQFLFFKKYNDLIGNNVQIVKAMLDKCV